MADYGIYYEVDLWQRETIFWACSVDVSEVDAESQLAVNRACRPFRVLHLPECPCLKELADLLVDCFLSFWSEAPSFLLDWFERWTDF